MTEAGSLSTLLLKAVVPRGGQESGLFLRMGGGMSRLIVPLLLRHLRIVFLVIVV